MLRVRRSTMAPGQQIMRICFLWWMIIALLSSSSSVSAFVVSRQCWRLHHHYQPEATPSAVAYASSPSSSSSSSAWTTTTSTTATTTSATSAATMATTTAASPRRTRLRRSAAGESSQRKRKKKKKKRILRQSTRSSASTSSSSRVLHPRNSRRRSTSTTTTVRKSKKKTAPKKADRQWDAMTERLRVFREQYGHTVVTNKDRDHADLYRWMGTLRKNYKHQITTTTTSASSSSSSSSAAWQPSPNATIALGSLASSSSSSSPVRQHLSESKLRQLQELDFCWDVQQALWERRYRELATFAQQHGHVQIPRSTTTTPLSTTTQTTTSSSSSKDDLRALAVWLANQKREYRRLERGEPSTLTLERLQKLLALNFTHQSRQEQWERRYQELVQFYQRYGHTRVPERYPPNPALGQWCMNQRTNHRKYQQQQQQLQQLQQEKEDYHNPPPSKEEEQPRAPTGSGLTQDRILLLEDLEFCWNLREYKWYDKLKRLQRYHQDHGHVQISGYDQEHGDLRVWLALQRYYYHQRTREEENDTAELVAHNDQSSSSRSLSSSSSVILTDARIEALEQAIPNFSWKGRVRGDDDGPSQEDWANLFDAMREKGIRPGMRAKQHWFEGENRFSGTPTKNVWTEEDLMELWNQEDDDDDDF